MRLVNNNKSTTKAELSIQPGAVVEVGPLLGAQLMAAGMTPGDYDISDGISEGELARLQAEREAELAEYEAACAAAEAAEVEAEVSTVTEELVAEVEAEVSTVTEELVAVVDDSTVEEGYVVVEAEVDDTTGEVTELVTEDRDAIEVAPDGTEVELPAEEPKGRRGRK